MAKKDWMTVDFHKWDENGIAIHKVTWFNGTNLYDETIDANQARWLKRAMSCGYEKAKKDLNGWLNTPGEM